MDDLFVRPRPADRRGRMGGIGSCFRLVIGDGAETSSNSEPAYPGAQRRRIHAGRSPLPGTADRIRQPTGTFRRPYGLFQLRNRLQLPVRTVRTRSRETGRPVYFHGVVDPRHRSRRGITYRSNTNARRAPVSNCSSRSQRADRSPTCRFRPQTTGSPSRST